jgi:hypothetical protein
LNIFGWPVQNSLDLLIDSRLIQRRFEEDLEEISLDFQSWGCHHKLPGILAQQLAPALL